MKEDFRRAKEKLVSYSLALSLLLSGCTEKSNVKKVYADDTFYYTEILYGEDGSITGTLPSDKVDDFVKIITFKFGDVTFTKLVVIEDRKNGSMRAPHYRIVNYCDLDTGTKLISYINHDVTGASNDHLSYAHGEDLEIVSVEDFLPYLYQAGNFQDVYDVNELISFYHEVVEPTLNTETDLSLN